LVSGAACLIAAAVVFAGLGVRAEEPAADDGVKEKKVTVRLAPVDGKNTVVLVDDEDDGDKKANKKDEKGAKDDKQKKEIRARVMTTDPMHGMNKADLEKKIRQALEKSKLSEDEVDRIVKEVSKAIEKAHQVTMTMPQMAVPKFDADFTPHVMQFGQGAGGNWTAFAGGHGRLGVSVDKPGQVLAEQLDLPKGKGLVIVHVGKDSAAEKAGLKTNDILIRFAGKEVAAEPMAFVKIVDGAAADDEVKAVIIRKGKKVTIDGIKLPEKKKAEGGEGSFNFTPGEGGGKFVIHGGEAKVIGPGGEGGKAIVRGGGGDKKADTTEKKSQKSVTVTINDGKYSAKENDGDVTITVTGEMNDGKVDVSNVTVTDDGERKSYRSLDKVPSKYRSRVEKLISSSSGDSPARSNLRKEKKDDNR